jgi:hypothetical protein
MHTRVFIARKQKNLCVRYQLRTSPFATEVGNGGATQSRSNENAP